MKHTRFIAGIGTALMIGLASAGPVFAQAATKILGGLNDAAKGFGSPPTANQLPTLVGSLIGSALALIGVLLLVYLLYGGFLWMTAGGDSKKVETAIATIRNAIIGLIIIVASGAISSFVLDRLGAAAAGTSAPAQTSGAGGATQ